MTLPRQKAFSIPLLSLTLSPMDKYTRVLETLVTTPKDALTALVLTHEQVVLEALVNVNSKLQDQEAAIMPA